MPKNKGPNKSGRGASNRPYRCPLGLVYDEFVGPLGPPDNGSYPELHVRYGVLDNLYVDWLISIQMRLGGIEQLSPEMPALPRRTWQRLFVDGSAIRHHKYDLYSSAQPPTAKTVRNLSFGEEQVVHDGYVAQMRLLHQSWVRSYGHDSHTAVTFGYVFKNLDPEFRDSEDFSWVRNTVIALASDRADEVFSDRSATYFSGRSSTAGVLLPNGVMKFVNSDSGRQPADHSDQASADSPLVARGPLTMGMVVDTIYGGAHIAQQVEDFLSDQ
ncbi:hypothetical protein [Nocardia brasiliensis]